MREVPLVFIHGIKGGGLKDGRGRRVYLRARHAFGLSTPDLSLPLNWDNGAQEEDGRTATTPLDKVAGKGIYGPILKWGKQHRDHFYPFGYDWRRDNHESRDRFIAFLESLRSKHDGPIQVAAHSMGGMISFAAVQQRPELFHSILFAGVPFGSGVDFARDMHLGAATGFNKKLLSAGVHFTFTSPYCFFPSDPDDSRIVDSSGDAVRHDWYSAQDWEDRSLSIQGKWSDNQRDHLTNALGVSREFRKLMEEPEMPDDCPPLAALAGDQHDTLCQLIRSDDWDFDSGDKEPGDARVTFAAATPPVDHTMYRSKRTHGELYHEVDQVAEILANLDTS